MPDVDDVVRAVLADTPPMTDEVFQHNRERVLTGKRKRRNWIHLAAAAAGVVLVASAALVITTPTTSEIPPATTVPNKAANMFPAVDQPLAPGQFRYVRTEQTIMNATEKCRYQERNIEELWIPADPEAEWMRRRDDGHVEWLTCQDPGASSLPVKFQKDDRAKYGTFEAEPGPPGWYNMTPQFLAGLPRDPQALYALIEQEFVTGTANPTKAYFQHAERVLETAALPADLRSAMYQAMTRIPGVTVTEGATTMDGRKGTGIGADLAGLRQEIIVDPVDGTFIGGRSLAPNGELSGGKVVTYGVAGSIGTPPTR